MTSPYLCEQELRHERTRASGLNGIDYVEVLDHDAPAGVAAQQTLLVHCLKPVSLTAANVRIEGGVRVTPVRVVWAAQASSIPAAAAPAAERAFFAGLPASDRVLAVRTDSSGDYSTYVLRLVAAGPDPFNFDPALTQRAFTFKAECPSDFDCEVTPWCPPEQDAEPAIDYLAKDYASFRRLLLDRLAVLVPDWSERHAADLGIALAELLAYAGDYLSYQQDAAATEAYLGTARKRVSARRHARLLDYAMHDGCNARAWVAFEADQNGDADGLPLKAQTQLVTQIPAPRGALDPLRLDDAVRRGAQVFETMYEITLRFARNAVRFYTWSDQECCLPTGATSATFRDEGAGLAAGDVLVFEERLGPSSGFAVDADPLRRHAVRLTRADPDVDPLDGTKVVRAEWHPEDALPFTLCLSTIASLDSGDTLLEDVTVALANVVLVEHGTLVDGEQLEPSIVPARGVYRPRLGRRGLVFHVPYEHRAALLVPAAAATRQDPAAAVPWLSLGAAGDQWSPVHDLLASERFSREFVVEVERDGVATLRFKNRTLGRAPEPGTAAPAPTYRIGGGRAGNVGRDAISHVLVAVNGIGDVRNPLPAARGVEPETLEQVRLYAPQAFRTQKRAVTEQDYADVVQQFAGVQRAVATRRWTGSWRTIFVTVDRLGGKPVDAQFERDLRSFVERFRLAGYDLEVDAPRYVPLDIAVTVCVEPGYFRDRVKLALLETLGSRTLPDGRRGFFHPDNFTFGQPVYLSRLVATAMGVAGVRWIDVDDTPPKTNRFRRFGEAAHGELAAGRISLGRLEVAQLDNDPSRPENGTLELTMAGGL